jgi:2-polyprenyl-3-methyl-5-hydroxy-6-metoxy-1,4-benzoquinol methylase
MIGLETVYKAHHKQRGDSFAILLAERGSFLKKHIGIGKKILDIGCRDGQLTSTYAENNFVTGADIDSHALEIAKNKLGIETIHADLNGEWPFNHESYDVVVACEFLEHVYFPEVIFEKVKKVLKKDGIFVGTIPHAYSYQSRVKFLLGTKRGTPLEDPTHINHFKYSDFRKILEKNFEIIDIQGYIPARYRLVSKFFPFAFAHDLMFCVKNNK